MYTQATFRSTVFLEFFVRGPPHISVFPVYRKTVGDQGDAPAIFFCAVGQWLAGWAPEATWLLGMVFDGTMAGQ
jgi:hypothetical protein